MGAPARKFLQRRQALRIVSLFAVGLALSFGWIGWAAHRRSDALSLVEDLGGSVSTGPGLLLQHMPLGFRRWLDDRFSGYDWTRPLRRVTRVSLSGTEADDEDLRRIGVLNGLDSISLMGTDVTDSGLVSLGRIKGLRRVNLNETRVTGVGARRMMCLNDDLEAIYFWNSGLVDAGLKELIPFSNLTILHADTPYVTNEGVAHVGEMAALRAVIFASPLITDDGLKPLSQLPRLGRLYLDNAKVKGDGMASLRGLQELEELSMRGASLTDEGVKHIGVLRELVFLRLSETQVTGNGLPHLNRLSKLESLYLDGTNVNDEDLLVLKQLPALRALSVQRTKVTDSGVEEFQKALGRRISVAF